MTSDPQRLEQLTLAASFCLFDKNLRSSGKGSIVWGLLNLLIGLVLVAANDYWGAFSAVLGLALIITGIYQIRVRDPKVIILSAVTLAALAIWNFAIVALAAMGKAHLASDGRILFWAVAQAYGAYATWKAYSNYKMLKEKSDPVTVQEIHGYIDELRKVKPEQAVDLIEFDANAGFVKGTRRYRLKPVQNLYLMACYKAQLGSLHLEELAFLPRNEVTLTPQSDKWMGKKIKASVQLGALRLEKVSITPEMALRINPAAQATVLGAN
jgi:hypothetical protein